MSLLDIGKKIVGGVTGLLTGNPITSTVLDALSGVDPLKKAEIEIKVKEIEHKINMEASTLGHTIQTEFNEHVEAMTGTAKDLMAMGKLGKFMLFVRGMQRPGVVALVCLFDYNCYINMAVYSDRAMTLLTAMNIVVLATLFGERAIKNVLPLLRAYMGKGAK
jgi:hypothetical protein